MRSFSSKIGNQKNSEDTLLTDLWALMLFAWGYVLLVWKNGNQELLLGYVAI